MERGYKNEGVIYMMNIRFFGRYPIQLEFVNDEKFPQYFIRLALILLTGIVSSVLLFLLIGSPPLDVNALIFLLSTVSILSSLGMIIFNNMAFILIYMVSGSVSRLKLLPAICVLWEGIRVGYYLTMISQLPFEQMVDVLCAHTHLLIEMFVIVTACVYSWVYIDHVREVDKRSIIDRILLRKVADEEAVIQVSVKYLWKQYITIIIPLIIFTALIEIFVARYFILLLAQ
jgi:hypothetical protein